MRRLAIQLLSSGDSPAKVVAPTEIKVKENPNEVDFCILMATCRFHSRKLQSERLTIVSYLYIIQIKFLLRTICTSTDCILANKD